MLHGRYRIVGLLGRGGMGEVYRADDTKLGQTVALKFLPDTLARDPSSVERFYAEIRVGRQVSHPNVCRLYDLVEVDGQHCLSMEYIDGEDLATLLARIGRLPSDKATEIARELCAGLAAAHDKGVIHRDLKPANVMLDGRGRVRITDFGLAAFAADMEREALGGTPAYMAPEQLEGKPASLQSDLYALGLTLYEVFTGKRLFDARSLVELKEQHAQKRPSLSGSVRDIPASVEQAVLHCLEHEPELRPASAHVVIAMLPGGDPLQAALAAGETPSPAMVAAAGKVGDLAVGTAWGMLVAALSLILLVAYLADTTTVIGRLHPDKSLEVLSEKAQQILERIGYGNPSAFRASWFWFDVGYLNFAAKQNPSPQRRDELERARPGPLIFFHRESPRPLAALRTAELVVLPAEVGRLRDDDPPMDVPGMTRLTLDRHGALIEFLAVPPLVEKHPATAPVDWSSLLIAAGLDPAALTPAPPSWTAPVDSDFKAAWDGTYAEQPQVRMHVEAAAFHGKPVWFAVLGPWVQPPEPDPPSVVRQALWLMLAFGALLWSTLAVMLRRSLRLGRADRRGGMVLAQVVFVSLLLGLLLRADHVAAVVAETSLVMTIIAQALFFAFITWMLYVALEPYARRRWPVLMISWTRLLAGRLRDPMVGRDVLVGALIGAAMIALVHLDVALPSGLGHIQRSPLGRVITPLNANRQTLFFFLITVYQAIGIGLSMLIGLLLMRKIVRFQVLAWAVMVGIAYLFFAIPTTPEAPWSAALALCAALWFILLMRVGLLAAAVASYFFFMLWYTPLTLDPGTFYAGRTLVCVGILAAVMFYAFHVSLAGKSAIAHALLERDDGG